MRYIDYRFRNYMLAHVYLTCTNFCVRIYGAVLLIYAAVVVGIFLNKNFEYILPAFAKCGVYICVATNSVVA